jgi:hypothetical protein
MARVQQCGKLVRLLLSFQLEQAQCKSELAAQEYIVSNYDKPELRSYYLYQSEGAILRYWTELLQCREESRSRVKTGIAVAVFKTNFSRAVCSKQIQ